MSRWVLVWHAQVGRADEELIGDQMHLAHRYYNRLIELERKLHETLEALCRSIDPQIVVVDAAIAAATATIDEERLKITGTRSWASGMTDEQAEEVVQAAKDAIAAAKADRSAAYASLKKLLKDVRRTPAYKEQATAARQQMYDARKAAYHEYHNLYWPTKNEVAQRVEQAAKSSFGNPSFRPWHRDGKIYVQIIKGAPAAEVADGSNRMVSIVGQSHGGKWVTVRFRVGTTPDNEPIFVTLRCRAHRPLPSTATVMGAAVVRRQGTWHRHKSDANPDGVWLPHDRFSVQFMLRDTLPTRQPSTRNIIGIDVGWRLIGEDLRVAVWRDSSGDGGELRLPADLLARWTTAFGIKSVMDRNFNGVKDAVQEWKAKVFEQLPEPLRAACEFAHAWRSPRAMIRFASSLYEYRSQVSREIAGDVGRIIEVLKAWRERHEHLDQYAIGTVRRAIRRRRDIFANFAAWVQGTYEHTCVEKINVAEMRKTPEPETEVILPPNLINWRNAAASGLLLEMIKAKAHGLVLVDCGGTTSKCHQCGGDMLGDRINLRLTCDGCGLVEDQDVNAARNILQRGIGEIERGGAGVRVGPARGPEGGGTNGHATQAAEFKGRWQRRKEARSQAAAAAAENTGV